MDVTNIFLGRYETRENQLTYCLLSLLEHLSPRTSAGLLSTLLGWSSGGSEMRTIIPEGLYGGAPGNPDGSLTLDYGLTARVIFLEVKSTRSCR